MFTVSKHRLVLVDHPLKRSHVAAGGPEKTEEGNLCFEASGGEVDFGFVAGTTGIGDFEGGPGSGNVLCFGQ